MEFLYKLLPFLLIALLLFLFNWLMGYRKGHIVIDLDNRYFNHTEYMKAIKEKLEAEGRIVRYEGHSRFEIDGEKYLMIERNMPMGGVPVQRTILKPVKSFKLDW